MDAAGGASAPSALDAMLSEAVKLLEQQQWRKALDAGDRALDLAGRLDERPAVALAQRARALALVRLGQSPDATAAWREALAVWGDLDDRPHQVEGLAGVGNVLVAQDASSTEGRALVDQAFDLAREVAAVDPLSAARALRDAGRAALGSGPRDNAIRLLAESVSILEHEAQVSVDLAESLCWLGRAQARRGRDPAPARATLGRALEMIRKVAPGSALEAECLQRLGRLEDTQQNDPAAIALYRQALAIWDVVDPEGFSTSVALVDLGGSEARAGDLDEARLATLRALGIRERMEADPAQVIEVVNNLGVIEWFAGNLAEAEAYLERSVAMEENLGRDPAALAQALINLGGVASERWRFDVARADYERALALLERAAPTHDAVGKALGNLREMTTRQGDLRAAEDYSRRAIAFLEAHYPDSLELAVELNGAGILAMKRGDHAAAKSHQLRALEIRQRKVPDSGGVADSLLWLATTCLALGQQDEAERHLRRALEISGGDSARGETSAQIVDSLGEVALRRGEVKLAEQLHRRALGLWKGFGGPDHPMVSTPLLGLAADLRSQGRYAEAFDAAERAQALRLGHLRFSSRALTEREALAYGGQAQEALDVVLTLASEAGERIPLARRRAFDAVVRSRAVVLDELAARHRSLQTSPDPDLVRLAADYGSARDSLARLAVEGPAEDDAGGHETAVAEARAAKDRAERALAARSSAFERDLARTRAGLDDVAGSLSPAGVLVSYVRYQPVAPGSSSLNVGRPSGQPLAAYAAFILPKGLSEPLMVPLGPAQEVEPLVGELRQLLSSPLPSIPTAEQRALEQYRSVGARLREAVWDPVAARLGASERVFVVPDGALNLVDLEALPAGGSHYLVESGLSFHYLSAERDVLGYAGSPGTGSMLAVGDPAFDEARLFAALAPGGAPLKLDDARRVATAAAFRGTRATCAGFGSLRFEPLPASADEVDEVVGLWRKRTEAQSTGGAGELFDLRGPAASEAAFKALASRAGMVHLATHGFLLGEGCAPGSQTEAVAGGSPLLLSGFALAGANHRAAAGPDEEDGILTAEEVAALDLTGVQWAVLSGCNTGVGEVRSGEGVFGLRRAFELAGARTLIMSLHPVGDEASGRWMRALYENRLEEEMSTADAVHGAKLELLRQRRAAGLSTHPLHWAGFIASGEWR